MSKAILIKFLIAMGGVIGSCLVIFLILVMFRKMFAKKRPHMAQNETIAETPTINDSVTFFINRNRMK